jgi:nucleotidyltransferase/DNA polymerase involved in DNA repair
VPERAIRGDILSTPIVAVELWPHLLIQAAWWADPATRERPLVIVSRTDHVLAAGHEAWRAGVRRGQTLTQARGHCPGLSALPPHRAVAAEIWTLALEALTAISPVVEAADEGIAYLDAHGLERLWGETAEVAGRTLWALGALGLAAHAAGAPRRACALALARCPAGTPQRGPARMPAASARRPPPGIAVRPGPARDPPAGTLAVPGWHGAAHPCALDDAGARAFMHALPLTHDVFGLEAAALADLDQLGLRTAGDLAALPLDTAALLGAPIAAAWRIATLTAEPPLCPWTPPPSLALAHDLEDDVDDRLRVERILCHLGACLGRDLQDRDAAAALVSLQLRCAAGPLLASAQQTPPVQTARDLAAAACALWATMRPPAPLEGLTLRVSCLQPARIEQQGLFSAEDKQSLPQRQERVSRLMQVFQVRSGGGRLHRLRPDPRQPASWVWEESDA